MCFSATASFGAGIALGAAGVLTLKKVQAPSQIAFASIPVLFAVQQMAEGLLWLSLTNENYREWETFSTKLFLFFAQVVWPLLIPLSVFLLEKDKKRKKILFFLTVIGALVATYFAYCLFIYSHKSAVISCHIDYTLNYPSSLAWISGLLYYIVTVLPSLLSGNKAVPLLGIMITVSYLFTKIFYANYLISVWCFFAAIISMLVLYIIIRVNKPVTPAKEKKPPLQAS